MVNYADKYEKLLVKNRTMVLSFPNKKDDEFEKLEYENFDIYKSYTYNYEYIIKLKSKDSEVITLDI